MSHKRLLFVQENKILSSFYREHLENGGFHVEMARSGREALDALEARIPDAVIIDSLTPDREADDVIREIRNRTATRELPVLALPATRAPMIKAVQQAGATRVLARTMNPPAELTDAVQTLLGCPRTATLDRCVPLQPGSRWLKTSSAEATRTLNEMRRSIQAATHESERPAALRTLLQEAHGLTEQLALFSQRPLFQYCAALECLAFDMSRFSDQTNPSTLRTMGQAVDFLSVLLREAATTELRDPASAQILAVDDEDGARKIIMAAMGMVNLRCLATESPSSGLSALRNQGFELIFLDVGLPEMTGFELCTRIRNHPMHERTPIVFITGMATFHNRAQSSLSGGNDFVGKPFNIPELGLKALMWVLKSQLSML